MREFYRITTMAAVLGAVMTAAGAQQDAISKIDKNMEVRNASTRNIKWHDPAEAPFRLSGLNWFKENKLFRRLPKLQGIPDGVEKLAYCTSGVTVAFKTDSSRIILKVKLAVPVHATWTTGRVGNSGFDLYTGGPGKWYTIGTGRVIDDLATLYSRPGHREMREYLINFPPYNGVKSVLIGLDEDAQIQPPSPYASSKRIVAYGGSVMQGAAASRPGRAFMNIIGRHFNLEVIILGFSGSSRFEPIMAQLTAEVENPGLVIVEGERNAGWKRIRELEPGFVSAIRKKHPGVPIVVMQGNPWWEPDVNRAKNMAEQKAFIAKMQPLDPDLYWWDCTDFIGPDHAEALVDGKHPSDLGFQRMVDHMIPLMEPILKKYGVIK